MTPSAYWTPHTSSIDFCEPNYLLTDVAVEPWNAASSLVFALFGVIGILYSNPTNEVRVTLLYSLLIIIGLGSTALHASLHWFAQSLDELPMLWLNVYTLFFLATLNVPLSSSSPELSWSVCDEEEGGSISSDKNANDIGKHQKSIAFALTLFAAFVTYVYYCMQSFYGIFVGGYIFTTVAVFSWIFTLLYISPEINSQSISHNVGTIACLKLASCLPLSVFQRSESMTMMSSSRKQRRLRLCSQASSCLKRVIVLFIFVGFTCWLVDMNLCQSLLPFYESYTWGWTLHVIWHIGAAYGGYLHIQTLILLRADALDLDLHLHRHSEYSPRGPDIGEWILSCLFLPVVRDRKTLQKSSSTLSTLNELSFSTIGSEVGINV